MFWGEQRAHMLLVVIVVFCLSPSRNFTGFVVSDYDAWADLVWTWDYCSNMTCAADKGINAGLDQEGGGNSAILGMPDAVSKGLVSAATVGQSLRRLMRTRIALGMMDPPTLVKPYNWLTKPMDVQNAAHQGWALEVARQSMCLYKNNGVLPLPSGGNNFALIGFQWADAFLLTGNYAQEPTAPGVVTMLAGLWRMGANDLGQAPCTTTTGTSYYSDPLWQTSYKAWTAEDCAALCASAQADQSCAYYTWLGPDWGDCYLNADASHAATTAGVTGGMCKSASPKVNWASGCSDAACASAGGFSAAVSSVAGASHILITFGLSQSQEYETGDRSTIELPGQQYALLAAVKAAATHGQKIVCLLVHGGTFALQNLQSDCDAILDGWYPGSQGGLAFAEALYGKFSPAGRTTVTWYNSTADLPPQTNNMNWYPDAATHSQGVSYRFFKAQPVLPFGFGLSYTTFKYSAVNVPVSAGPCDDIQVSFDVQNVGSVDSDEVTQVYVKTPGASVAAPQVRLVAFQRVHLKAGAPPTRVTLSISPAFHSVVTNEGLDGFWAPTRMVEQGQVEVSVGGGQPDFTTGTTTLPVGITSSINLDSCPKPKTQ